jgi:predicted small secreted protein
MVFLRDTIQLIHIKAVSPSGAHVRNTMRAVTILILLFGTLMLTGCNNAPGASGQYATHDRGNGTVDPSAPWYSSSRLY